MRASRYISAAFFLFIIIAVIVGWKQIVVYNDASTIQVVQFPSGSLHVYDTPGYHMRWLGSYETFNRSNQYWFSPKKDEGNEGDESIKTRFNDGAHAYIGGSLRWDMPNNPDNVIDLYRTYHTQKAISHELVGQNVTKAVYMTGPLMSSKESYSDKRNELINFIEDQAAYGVYQTKSSDKIVLDLVTQEKKTMKVVDLIKDDENKVLRQENSPLIRFAIHLYNLNINEVRYDEVVEKQIAQQQDAIMQVQTAIAQSKKAEQDALTTEQKGKANAAAAKWEQEVIKAKAVTQAQQEAEVATTNANRDKLVAVTSANREKEVAELAGTQRKNVASMDKDAADFKKQEQIALGEGEATRAKLVMQANGALEQKLAAWVDSQKAWATAFSQYKGQITPMIVTGGANGSTAAGTGGNDNAFNQFMQLISAKTAASLALDMKMSTNDVK